jgi:putative transposase
VPEARVEISAFRLDYNEVRPHSSLGQMTPSEFAAQLGARAVG